VLDEVALIEGVLDWIAMIIAQHLDYLVEADMVDLASLLLMDPVDHHDKLAVAVPLAILLALYPSITVFSLVCGFSLSLTLVFVEDCMDIILAEDVACCEVEQFPHRPQFAASELMDKCFIGRAGDESSDHVRIHDIKKLIALLGKAVDVRARSLSHLLLAGFEILGISRAHVRALKVPTKMRLKSAHEWMLSAVRCSSHAHALSSR